MRRPLKAAAAALAALLLAGPVAADEAPALKLTGSETWNNPVPPFRIADNLYYVGATDIASYLIVTDAGLALIDGGYPETAGQILANIKTLGFDPKAVKILISSHAHFDHAGGLAEIKAATGALLYASAEDGALMRRGGKGDFFLGDKYPYPPVTPDRILADGQKVSIGDVTLTAHLTPGHTKGCTTWTWPVKDKDGSAHTAIDFCSASVAANSLVPEQYPGEVADYRRTFRVGPSIAGDLFLAPHGEQFGMKAKRARLGQPGPNPFLDRAGYERLLASQKADFEKQLAAAQAKAQTKAK